MVPSVVKTCSLNREAALMSDHRFKRTQRDNVQPCNGFLKGERALAHLLMLQAMTLHATAKHTFAIRRTRGVLFHENVSVPSSLPQS